MIMIDIQMPENCNVCPFMKQSIMAYGRQCILRKGIVFFPEQTKRHKDCPLIGMGKDRAQKGGGHED